MTKTETDQRLASLREAINAALDALLTGDAGASSRDAGASSRDAAPPRSILEAVRYAVLGPGKRLRPILLLASGEAAGARREDLIHAACAVEMIHAFSLVHDDLPALDNDDLRRGRPTVHVKFGEATAILAGDALLNLAFETLARHPEEPRMAPRKIDALMEIAGAVGLSGMIGGQVLDLEFEGKTATAADLEAIHSRKTGALITGCCVAGGRLAGAEPGLVHALRLYGSALGLAFQITDDILDVEGTAAQIGKSPGKDAKAAKATYPSVWGMERSKRLASASVAAALEALAPFGARADLLAELARSVESRRS